MEQFNPTFQENVNLTPANEDEFETLLTQGKVDQAKNMMDCNTEECMKALAEYDPHNHKITRRPNKPRKNKKGEPLPSIKTAKLPIPYQVYINEVALVFLFGQPVMWQQLSEGTDEAFARFQEVIKNTRFNAKIRQCKRIAGAETQSAMLFRAYRDDDRQPALQLRVLAHSRGDLLYTRFDQYDNLIAFAWGYNVKQRENETETRLDVFTKDNVYYCSRRETDTGWQVQVERNIIGKIPIILFRQEKEWEGVEPLIAREEMIASKTADTNDYFSDPYMVADANVIRNLPDRDEVGKLLVTNNTDKDVKSVVGYLTWDNAPESKQQEISWLHDQILSKTFTPDIKLDTLKSLGNLSGKALRTVMLLADIKANKRKEVYDEMLDRTASLITTIIGNVLDVRLKSQCDNLRVAHVWQEPFGEDVASTLESITKAVDGNILSQETAVEINPLVQDSVTEKRRLQDEQTERQRQQDSLFGATGGRAIVMNTPTESANANEE